MLIRKARQQDALLLSQLIYASGSQVLDTVFGQQPICQDFLHSALQQADGQYGFNNHWLAVDGDKVLGSISAWHHELGEQFHQASLKRVIDYYGIEQGLDVIARSQILRQFIPPPQAEEWCIGHLAVFAPHQRQGVASQLLSYMAKAAIKHHKTLLSLDVGQDNQGATAFYLRHGFSVTACSELTPDMQQLGFSRHLHLQKSLV